MPIVYKNSCNCFIDSNKTHSVTAKKDTFNHLFFGFGVCLPLAVCFYVGMRLLSCSPRASSEMPLRLALAVSVCAALAPASVLPSMPLMYPLCKLAQTPHHTTGSPYSPKRMDTLHLHEQAHTDKYSLSLTHTHTHTHTCALHSSRKILRWNNLSRVSDTAL